MNFVVRSARPVAALLPEIRRAVQSVDPELAIHQVASMRDIIQRSMTLERAASVLTTFFAFAALLLTTLGVYGVVSYFVRHRRAEIGTRMALGATSRSVLSLIVGGGVTMAALGVLVGGVLGLGAGRCYWCAPSRSGTSGLFRSSQRPRLSVLWRWRRLRSRRGERRSSPRRWRSGTAAGVGVKAARQKVERGSDYVR